MTLNNILKEFQSLATSHKQINGYADGQLYDLVTSGDIQYPFLFSILENSQLGNRVEALTFTFVLMDIVKGGRVNEDDVNSDMLEIVKDILAQLHHPSYAWDFENDLVTIEPFTESFVDSVAGYSFKVTLLLPFAYDRCVMPFNPTDITPTPPSSILIYMREITLISGTIDGLNSTYIWQHIPMQVYLNGQLLRESVGYTLSGTTIVLTTPPYTGDYLWAYGNY